MPAMKSLSALALCAPAPGRMTLLCGLFLLPATLRATDADGDGIPSTWESTYSGSPAYMSDSDPTDASEDADGDFSYQPR